ncbi:MAG: nucleotidyl transferase AbiEii/AbiGii toxin family protein [Gemmatimonadales bacterium]|nr:nucleotidyl transferase AbiEii/AbiGii toxin family protein [Gemmatimonadales bacterium]MDZ4390846.1 nucleotidyl transferase AbiEii/AbiGii toxin family protein [Gemmatimonadales bacterium]
MIGENHRLRPGHVARHLPTGATATQEIALLDIAQDFLLAHLHEGDVFSMAVFKGGTALRKLWAGGAGRFSTDIDLAAELQFAEDRAGVAAMIADLCSCTLGPFRFSSTASRGRHVVTVESDLGTLGQTIKLEVGAPVWLTPASRPFVPLGSHKLYGFPLPALASMRLEEVIAEKIARLTRQSTARDAYDLVWLATTSPWSQFDRALVRYLVALKVWVDCHGVGDVWRPALHPQPFDAATWLAPREEWDDEAIGLLASPPPTLDTLGGELGRLFGWLADMNAEEARWAEARAGDRTNILRALKSLPGGRLVQLNLY